MEGVQIRVAANLIIGSVGGNFIVGKGANICRPEVKRFAACVESRLGIISFCVTERLLGSS